MNKGIKYDKGKPKIWRLLTQFPLAIAAVAKVSEYGHETYKEGGGWDNWSAVEDGYERYSDALGRHLMEDGVDPSTHLHDAHAAWNALARLELKLREDDG